VARRFRRILAFKTFETHADTKVHNIGPGNVSFPNHIIRDTEVGARSTAGGDTTIQVGRGLGEECNVGDLCKYVNLFIQVGPRTPTTSVNTGWIEWAFVCKREGDIDPVVTNIGVLTLGTICKNYFRNECVMTGFIPVAEQISNGQNIIIKIPKSKVRLTVGDQYILYLYGRTVSSTESGTANFRVITSFMYKNYH